MGVARAGSIIEVGLADRDAVLVREGDQAVARFDAIPGVEFPGRVSQIAAAADAGTGTYAVEISLQGAADLTAGLVGQVEIGRATAHRPRWSPSRRSSRPTERKPLCTRFRLTGLRAERRRVTVAFIDGDRVAVARGLEGVTTVLTDGAAYVDEGVVVRVTP